MQKISVLLVVILIGGVCACSKNEYHQPPYPGYINTDTLNAQDRAFITQASYAYNGANSAARLADSLGTNDSVKAYAKSIVNSTASNTSLDSIAGYLGVSTPTASDSIHQVYNQRLSGLTGRAFDSTYVHGQVTDFQNEQTLYNNEINSGSSTYVRNFATQYMAGVQNNYNSFNSIEPQF